MVLLSGREPGKCERDSFMYNMTAIVPKGHGIGFTLAGVQVRESANITDAQRVLNEEINDEHNGIILIDESFAGDLTPELQKKVDESTIPLVMSIPIITKWEIIHDRDEIIGNIIHRAVGYRIKFSEGAE